MKWKNTPVPLTILSSEWWHNSCTRYASLASSQIPGWIQNTISKQKSMAAEINRCSLFKTLLVVFKGLNAWQGMITQSKSTRYYIRSNEEGILAVPKYKHDTFDKRAFAVCGPLAWTCLPTEIRLCDEIEAFKRNLEIPLFVKFVNKSTLVIWFEELL